MSQVSLGLHREPKNSKAVITVLIFLFIAAAGLMYVKWWPYYHRALTASGTHSIGKSILGTPASAIGSPSWNDAIQYAGKYFKSVWMAAVLGLILGSLVQVLIPVRWLHRVLGKANFKSVFYGGIASLPGMMCTCCAAPIAAGLRRKNVSAGSALAFWLGNPLLNPATLIFMSFVLSWKFAVLRVIFGVLLTFGVGYLANRMIKGQEVTNPNLVNVQAVSNDPQGSFWVRWMKSLSVMLLQIVPAYLIAVLVLGALKVWFFPVAGVSGTAALILFAIAGALFVIPTAAEIPIIQSFMAAGMSTGPVAALLLTLPAVSLPSLLMLSRSFPRRILLFTLGSVIVAGILSGVAGSLFI
jgi:uncharacterized membrane protein YraQ (UPF0718 family)